jgi:CubicO group peptidase (beta-lactamase class C family)
MNGIAGLDQYFRGIVNRSELPGVVAAVSHKNQRIYHQAFGKMDVSNNIEMQKDSIFDIASMVKPITSVAVMMLFEAGKLGLDDPISKYLPSQKNQKVITHFNEKDATYSARPVENEITIRHLLTSTSGHGYGFSNHTVNILMEKTGKESDALPLLHEPGTKWTYGMGTRLSGKIIEVITGASIDEFFEESIFSPLQMDDTFYKIPQEKLSRWVTVHDRVDGIPVEQPKPEIQEALVLGDGWLHSTAEDYIAFLLMFLNGGKLHGSRILKEETINSMTENQIGDLVVEQQPGAIPSWSDAFPFGAGIDKYGLGFQISVADNKLTDMRSPGSYSWGGIYNTHFWVDPQKEIAAVILMQMLPFYNEACINALQNFERLVYNHIK